MCSKKIRANPPVDQLDKRAKTAQHRRTMEKPDAKKPYGKTVRRVITGVLLIQGLGVAERIWSTLDGPKDTTEQKSKVTHSTPSSTENPPNDSQQELSGKEILRKLLGLRTLSGIAAQYDGELSPEKEMEKAVIDCARKKAAEDGLMLNCSNSSTSDDGCRIQEGLEDPESENNTERIRTKLHIMPPDEDGDLKVSLGTFYHDVSDATNYFGFLAEANVSGYNDATEGYNAYYPTYSDEDTRIAKEDVESVCESMYGILQEAPLLADAYPKFESPEEFKLAAFEAVDANLETNPALQGVKDFDLDWPKYWQGWNGVQDYAFDQAAIDEEQQTDLASLEGSLSNGGATIESGIYDNEVKVGEENPVYVSSEPRTWGEWFVVKDPSGNILCEDSEAGVLRCIEQLGG